MWRTSGDERSKKSDYATPIKAPHKYEKSHVKKPHLSGNRCSGAPLQTPSSSHSFPDIDDVSLTILSRNNKHLKQIDRTKVSNTVPKTLKESNKSTQVIRAKTPTRELSHISITNKCMTSGNAGNRKSKKVSNCNLKVPRSSLNSMKFNSPFVRGLEEFIITDDESKVTTPLRRQKALSEKHIERIGKPHEVIRTKRHTPLKRSILNERAIRKSQRSHSLPAPVGITFDSTESSSVTKITEFRTPDSFNNSLKEPTSSSEIEKYLAMTTYLVVKRFALITYDEKEAENKIVLSALEKVLCQIWELAKECDPPVPIIITHTRKKLAHLCHKPRLVSVVGIINADGAYEVEKKLLDMKSGVNLRCTTSLGTAQINTVNELTVGNSNATIIVSTLVIHLIFFAQFVYGNRVLSQQ
uniref:Ribosomal protein L7Ae/L30e/S12e/Gadd45 domain-containing protein n=1 Tax=Schistosoma haematobium TaxID=6185 RepID=A0A095A0M2_SCHHA